MKIAVISVTWEGLKLSLKIAEALENTQVLLYFPSKYSEVCDFPENIQVRSFDSIFVLTKKIFNKYNAIIFVCACGIAVRAIAPHVRSKISDPAVIVVDISGKFCISLLSGHLGGANSLTEKIAYSIDAVPVITTATDTGGKFSPDSFARANNLVIQDMNIAKETACAVLRGEKIGLVSDYSCRNIPREITCDTDCHSGIIISPYMVESPFEVTLRLFTKNIILGIGCKKGVSRETIERVVYRVLSENNIAVESVCGIGSVSLKSEEKGLLDFCEKLGINPVFHTPRQLMDLEGDFTPSEFVMKTVGADNVCERSAIAAGGNRLITRKYSENGVTVAIAEKNVDIDFGRKIY